VVKYFITFCIGFAFVLLVYHNRRKIIEEIKNFVSCKISQIVQVQCKDIICPLENQLSLEATNFSLTHVKASNLILQAAYNIIYSSLPYCRLHKPEFFITAS